MQVSGWIQFALYLVALALITKPMGLYLLQVLDANGRTWLDPVLRPLERLTYRLMGVDPKREQNWKQYTFAMLLFSLVGCIFTYVILRLQHLLPLNPQGLGPSARTPRLQHRGQFHDQHQLAELCRRNHHVLFLPDGRPDLSQFRFRRHRHCHRRCTRSRQLRGIPLERRQFLGRSRARDLLPALPICVVFAVFLVSQGMIQNFKPYTKATLVEPMKIAGREEERQG